MRLRMGRGWPHIAWAMLAGVVACTETSVESLAVGSVAIAPQDVALSLGDSVQLTAAVRDISGQVLQDRGVTWASNDPRVARVSATGMLTAVGAGATTVTAESEGRADEVSVVVTVSLTAVSAGLFHTCGTTDGSRAACWGTNGWGELGDGTIFSSLRPQLVARGLEFLDVVAGGTQTCGLTLNGTVYCWGANWSGQLGIGQFDMDNHPLPRPVLGLGVYEVLSVGDRHACAWSLDGSVACWGGGFSGQLGNGTGSMTCPGVPEPCNLTPDLVAGALEFSMVAAGEEHSCGLTTAGEAYCWGDNSFGALGDSTNLSRSVPTRVAGGHVYTAITTGRRHTCALTSSGQAYCWGMNNDGQLGTGSNVSTQAPAPVAGGIPFIHVDAGGEHTCAVSMDGAGYCWGRNDRAQLGVDSFESQNQPTAVAGQERFRAVSGGWFHSCGVSVDGIVYCWGNNSSGQLGTGDGSNRLVPTKVFGQP